LFERISAFVAAVRVVPAARLRATGFAGAASLAVGGGVDGLVVGRGVLVRVRGAGAGALAVGRSAVAGRSFSSADVSTGASCRSRLRLSAVAMSLLSLLPHAATAISVSPAIIALDIYASLDVTCSGSATR
jgi:hypothetical protein